MRNALLFLAITLTILFLAGGPDALTEALIRLFVLGGIQVITHYLNQTADRRRELKKFEPSLLKKEKHKDLNSGPR
jgi:hypothetical protein